MKIIFPMAGAGSRFKSAGYECEKYEIIVNGKTLFEYSVESLLEFNDGINEFIFIGRKETDFVAFCGHLLDEMGINNYRFVELDEMTSGQAQTVYEYTQQIQDSNILIFNIDSFIKKSVIKPSDINTDYWWLVSDLLGEKWSFIEILSDGTFKTSEKKKTSNNASLGMYYFKSSNEFNKIYNNFSQEIKKRWSEMYIAPLYNYVKGTMSLKTLDKEEFNTLGTPEELDKFKNKIKTDENYEG